MEGYPKTVIEVKAPCCESVYNLRTDQQRFRRNCRCGKGSFRIEQGKGFNEIRVFFANQYGMETEFKDFSIITQEK